MKTLKNFSPLLAFAAITYIGGLALHKLFPAVNPCQIGQAAGMVGVGVMLWLEDIIND